MSRPIGKQHGHLGGSGDRRPGPGLVPGDQPEVHEPVPRNLRQGLVGGPGGHFSCESVGHLAKKNKVLSSLDFVELGVVEFSARLPGPRGAIAKLRRIDSFANDNDNFANFKLLKSSFLLTGFSCL